jgi:hypothetical protein
MWLIEKKIFTFFSLFTGLLSTTSALKHNPDNISELRAYIDSDGFNRYINNMHSRVLKVSEKTNG